MNQEDKPRSRWIWAVPFGLILVATGGAIEWARQQEIAYHRLIAVLPMILQAVQSGRQAPVWWAMAARSLGFTTRVSPTVVIETLWRRLEHLHGLPESLMPWLVLSIGTLLVFGYWIKESQIEKVTKAHQTVTAQLMAITEGWAEIANDRDPSDLIHRILEHLTRYTAISEAALYHWVAEERHNAVHLYSVIGSGKLLPLPVPRLLAEDPAGVLGSTMVSHHPHYSGDGSSPIAPLIPGIIRARLGVFPVGYRDKFWGWLICSSGERGWFTRYQELLSVTAHELGILLVSTEYAKQAAQTTRLEELARARSEILANVSHELRTPLGLIRGYAETLGTVGSRLTDDERQEFLSVVLSETQLLENLIDHLLIMSRLDGAGVVLNWGKAVGRQWISEVVRRLPSEQQQRVQVSVPDTLFVMGDIRQLSWVLQDLIANALKYSDGLVYVTLTADAAGYRLTVRDEGEGVGSQEIDRIFERFYRSPRHAHSDIRGTGLGLSIAQRIVEAHNGIIRAENLIPQGFQVVVQWHGHTGGEVS